MTLRGAPGPGFGAATGAGASATATTSAVGAGKAGADGRAWFHFSVTDTGIGIPLDKQERIFEAFVQADDATTRIYGGTGLGLTISRRLCEMMGGHLTVQSELGVGSTFVAAIPAMLVGAV